MVSSPGPTVLVTGGSGFLGGWCVIELLRRGYTVRTTVRSLSREPQVRAAIGAEVDPGDRLAVLPADLESDEGWLEAVEGCEYVLHVASPFPPKQPKDPDELIRSDPTAWPTLVRDAIPVIDFVLRRLGERHDLATPQGKRAAADEMIEVEVSDTGTGFHDDVKPNLFQTFFTTKETGMGVGLSISRSIIEAHGGRMWAETNPSGGATFRFTLPIAPNES